MKRQILVLTIIFGLLVRAFADAPPMVNVLAGSRTNCTTITITNNALVPVNITLCNWPTNTVFPLMYGTLGGATNYSSPYGRFYSSSNMPPQSWATIAPVVHSFSGLTVVIKPSGTNDMPPAGTVTVTLNP